MPGRGYASTAGDCSLHVQRWHDHDQRDGTYSKRIKCNILGQHNNPLVLLFFLFSLLAFYFVFCFSFFGFFNFFSFLAARPALVAPHLVPEQVLSGSFIVLDLICNNLLQPVQAL